MLLPFIWLVWIPLFTIAQSKSNFAPIDVFGLQYVQQPKISPDGKTVVYRRMKMDIQKDRSMGNLWKIQSNGSGHQKLTSFDGNEFGAVWSPSGDRIAYARSTDQGSEIYVYWLQSGKTARLSQLNGSPSALSWSPDGQQLAFRMKVKSKVPNLIKMPPKPKGAQWAPPARITDRLYHEADGSGYITPGFAHVFVMDALGSTPRQVTRGDFQHKGPISWHPKGDKLYITANRNEDWEYDFRNSEVYEITLTTGDTKALTDRPGPDYNAIISPNGQYIAYLGYKDKTQAYQNRQLWIMDPQGKNHTLISGTIDSSISQMQWDDKSQGLYVSYDQEGDTKIAYLKRDGGFRLVADHLGGTSIGRPYGGGSFSVATKGQIAYTLASPYAPAELAIVTTKGQQQLTNINKAVLGQRTLGTVNEIRYTSSFDGRSIQGWVVYPPDYDATKKYPLLVENHGGPISNYGARFSAEIQLYAAAGYIVFYPNPRGSTSYGEEFANLLYHNYPGEDYQDVMDGVDHLIEKGLAHEDQLYVTGGSAGGIMTAWMIGKNNRFKAAVVVKPVMNWISKTLVADNYFYYANNRFPGQPWENFQAYWNFSPLSLVGNIETPTMVMVGMNDLRTPPSEAKQLYHALKIRKIPTVLVEIPQASHGIAKRPSNLITKVAHILAWLEKYR
ncbi:MAG: S9 family peptidase [Flavobacteriaceae bacterium]